MAIRSRLLSNFFPTFDSVWRHYSIPIPSTATGVGNFLGVGLYCWQPGGTTGTLTYDVKNVVVKAKIVPIPPPTLEALEKVKATGLWLGTYAGGGGARNSVYTPNTNGSGVSWVGVATPANPVTYSMTIAQYPNSVQLPRHPEPYLPLLRHRQWRGRPGMELDQRHFLPGGE